jgi:hypothetical protein
LTVEEGRKYIGREVKIGPHHGTLEKVWQLSNGMIVGQFANIMVMNLEILRYKNDEGKYMPISA